MGKVRIFTDTADECCDKCAANDLCNAFVWGHNFNHTIGKHSCYLKSSLKSRDPGNCSAACVLAEGDCSSSKFNSNVVDLWHTPGDGTQGPALGYNNTCVEGNPNGGEPSTCQAGPKGDTW